MAKYNRNTGKSWSGAEEAKLRRLAGSNTPTRVVGLKLGRTEAAVRSKAHEIRLSLRPNNRSPYGRKK